MQYRRVWRLASAVLQVLRLSNVPPLQVEGLKKKVSVAAIRALAILGQNDEVWRAVGRPGHSGRGVRILAMDGGGMKVRGSPHAVLGHEFIHQAPLHCKDTDLL